jgi:hypothetical protein
MGPVSATPQVPSVLSADVSGTAVRALVGTGLAALGAWMLGYAAHEQNTVSWECAAGTCATDDFAGAAPVLGIIVLVVALAVLSPLTRRATPGLVVAVGSGAWLAGLRAAVRDHLATEQEVRRATVVLGVVLALAVVAAAAGAVRSLGPSTLARARGLTRTWARVGDYENVGGSRCRATVHFDDAHGVRHSVRTEVPRDAFRHAPHAYYDPTRPDDPDRLRVVVPGQPLTAAARTARDEAVRVLLPLPEDDLASQPPGASGSSASSASPAPSASRAGSVVDHLERLAALHRDGVLTDAELAAAKARVLDDRVR